MTWDYVETQTTSYHTMKVVIALHLNRSCNVSIAIIVFYGSKRKQNDPAKTKTKIFLENGYRDL